MTINKISKDVVEIVETYERRDVFDKATLLKEKELKEAELKKINELLKLLE